MDIAAQRRQTPWAALLLTVVACIATGWLAAWLGGQAVDARGLALVAASIALAISSATMLSRARLLGIFLGLYTVGVQIIPWTVEEPGLAIYAFTAAAAAIVSVASVGGTRLGIGRVVRHPLFLLGVGSWAPGLLGPALAGAWIVGAQRAIQASILLALFVAVHKHRDRVGLAWGLVVGHSIALLVVTSCAFTQPLTAAEHAVLFTTGRAGAFAGGHCAVMHPNLIAIFAFALAVCWMSLRGAPVVARWFGVSGALVLLSMTGSRTAVAATLIALAVWIATRAQLLDGQSPRSQRTGVGRRSVTVFVVIALLGSAGYVIGKQFFQHERFSGGGALSGRELIWQESIREIEGGGALGLLLGQVQTPNLEVEVSGATAVRGHNAAVDLVGRAGLLGLLIALTGLLLLARRYVRWVARPEVAFSNALILGAVATTVTESFLLGSLFVWIVVAEADAAALAEGDRA